MTTRSLYPHPLNLNFWFLLSHRDAAAGKQRIPCPSTNWHVPPCEMQERPNTQRMSRLEMDRNMRGDRTGEVKRQRKGFDQRERAGLSKASQKEP